MDNFSCQLHSSLTDISSWSFNDPNKGWDSASLVKMYFRHSETQRQWAWESLGKISFLGKEKVLDFGCGEGKITAEIARLVKNGLVLGLDISKEMIHFARVLFPDYTFPNLKFENTKSITLSDFPGKRDYDLVCAFTVFHLIPNPLEVLKKLNRHLKPSGKLLLVIPTGENSAVFQAINEIFAKYKIELPQKDKALSNNPRMHTLDGCSFFLKEAGYTIKSLKVIDTKNPFWDLDDFILWMMSTSTPIWKLPAEINQSLLFTDLVYRMHELDPTMIDEEGHILFTMPRIHVTAIPNL